MQYYVRKTGAAPSGIFLAGIVLAALFFISPSPTHAATIGKPPYLLTLTSGLVGHWTFDGRDMTSGKAADISGQANTGTLVNIATSTFYAPGKIGQGLKFDGGNDYINAGTSASLNINGAITISAWVKTVTSVLNDGLIVRGTIAGALNQEQYHLSFADTQNPRISISNGTSRLISTGGANSAPDGVWNYIVATYNGTDTTRLYINGVQVDTDTTADFGSLNSTASGVSIGSVSGLCCALDGILDDVRIYNRVLSTTEITQLYNFGAAKTGVTKTTDPLKNGLVGHWTLDGRDMTSGVARDISGNANHGNLSGIATSTFYAPGKIGQGGNFDGTNDEILLDGLSSLDFSGTNKFTIGAWVYPGGGNAADNVFNRGASFSSAVNQIYYLAVNSSDATKWQTVISDGTNMIQVISSAGAVSVNQWQYMSIVWDGTTLSLYKNGALLTSGTGTFTGLWNGDDANDRETSIGADARSEVAYWNGKIDDVRAYNRALSPAEITQLYNLGVAKQAVTVTSDPLKNGLVGHWTFDGRDMTSGVARDISGQGNNGSLTNIATSTFYAPGKMGQGLNFDGVDDYITVSHNAVLNPSEITISFWTKLISAPPSNNHGFIDKNGSAGYRIRCGQVNPCILGFNFSGLSGAASNNLTLNQWTHVVLVGNSSGTRFYLDGVAGTLDTDAYAAGATTGSLLMGVTLSSINATLDDVRIYNRALSTSEISQLYNMGK